MGLVRAAFAGEVQGAGSTIKVWMGAHPAFAEALRVGTARRVLFAEQLLLAGETGRRVTSHIFALKNADPEEWRDKREHGFTDKDGNDLNFAVAFVPAKNEG